MTIDTVDKVEKVQSPGRSDVSMARLGKAEQRLNASGNATWNEPVEVNRSLTEVEADRQADRAMEAARQDPPDLERVNQLLQDASSEQQGELLEQLDGEELIRSLGGEDVTHEQRVRFFEELSAMAAEVGDPALLDEFAESLATGLDEELSDRVADALEESLRNGANGGLSVAMLSHAEGEVAEYLADKMAQGFKGFYDRVQEVGDEVARLNGDLAYLVQSFGPMMSPEELQASIEEYRAQHPEYAELERFGGNAVANIEQVQQFNSVVAEKVGDQGLRQEIDEDVNVSGASTAAAQALATASGQEALGDLLEREGNGEETWISTMDRCSPQDVTRPDFREALFTSGISQAAAAAVDDPGRARAILEGIGASGGLVGLEGDEAAQVTSELQSVLDAAASGQPDALNAALDQFDEVIGGLGDGLSAASGARLRAAGASLGVAGLGLSGADLASHPSFQNLASFMAQGTELAADLPKVQALLKNAFGTAGGATAARIAGGAGVLMSLWDAGQSFLEGDTAAGLLNLGGAFGGYLVAAGSTGIGLLVGGAAVLGMVGLEQWRKTRASNYFEEHPATELFLRGALSDSDLSDEEMDRAINQLRNADSSGRLNGILIQQAAEQLGLDPGALLNLIAQLDPGDIRSLMRQGHDIDPTVQEDLTSLDPGKVQVWISALRQLGLAIPCD